MVVKFDLCEPTERYNGQRFIYDGHWLYTVETSYDSEGNIVEHAGREGIVKKDELKIFKKFIETIMED